MHSIIQDGLIPGGKCLKRDRESVFFTALNPMYANQDLEEVQYDLDKPRITVYKNTWRVHQKTVYWCNLKSPKEKDCCSIKLDRTQSSFQHTTCDLY